MMERHIGAKHRCKTRQQQTRFLGLLPHGDLVSNAQGLDLGRPTDSVFVTLVEMDLKNSNVDLCCLRDSYKTNQSQLGGDSAHL